MTFPPWSQRARWSSFSLRFPRSPRLELRRWKGSGSFPLLRLEGDGVLLDGLLDDGDLLLEPYTLDMAELLDPSWSDPGVLRMLLVSDSSSSAITIFWSMTSSPSLCAKNIMSVAITETHVSKESTTYSTSCLGCNPASIISPASLSAPSRVSTTTTPPSTACLW